MKPKVSVIIPCYNVAGFLSRCMDSLRMQTLADLQIICVNDCSTDNTAEMLKVAMLRDPRIEIYKTPKNSGPGVARNLGMKHATGEYIGFIDPDDWVEFDWYEKLYNAATREHAQYAVGQMKLADVNGHIKKKNQTDGVSLLGVRSWRCIFLAEWLREIHAEFADAYIAEDTFFEITVITHLQTPVIVHDAYYVHFLNPVSLSSSRATKRQIEDICKIYPDVWDKLNASNLPQEPYRIAVMERFRFLSDVFYYKVFELNDKVRVAQLMLELWRKMKFPIYDIVEDEALRGILHDGDIQKLLDYMFRRATNIIYVYKMFGVPFMRVHERYRTRSTYIFGVPVVKRKFFLGM